MRHIHREIKKMITPYLKTGIVRLEDGASHAKLRHSVSLDFLPLAGSPSDYRCLRNFCSDLRRLVEHGEGMIFCKTGHLPLNKRA